MNSLFTTTSALILRGKTKTRMCVREIKMKVTRTRFISHGIGLKSYDSQVVTHDEILC